MAERAIWQYLETIDYIDPSVYAAPPEAPSLEKWFTPGAEPIHLAYSKCWPSDCLWVDPKTLKSVDSDPCAWFGGGERFQRRVLQMPPAIYVETSGPMTRFYALARGKYRIFGEAEYRLYWDSTPPVEGGSPQATAASLPSTPADTFADGTWYLSMSYFNGIIDSGFFPVGDAGETYFVLVIASGLEVATPPPGPQSWRIEQRTGGIVRVFGMLYSTGDNAPDKWAIAYTTDGSTPAEDTPTASADLAQDSLAVLSYDLPAQSHGTVVKVRLQTCRNDGTDAVPVWVYSDGSTVKTITIDTAGPAAPPSGDRWPGSLPEEF